MTKRRNFTPEFKAEVVLEALSGETSQAELCRRHNLSEQQLSKWKQQVVENVATLFVPLRISSRARRRSASAHLEQLVGRLTVALDIEKKAATWLNSASSEKREMVETVRNTSSYSVRQICQTLGFNGTVRTGKRSSTDGCQFRTPFLPGYGLETLHGYFDSPGRMPGYLSLLSSGSILACGSRSLDVFA